MIRRIGCGVAFLATAVSVLAAGLGDSVVVVYNKNLRDSKKLAEYYAEKRAIPTKQLFAVDVSATSEQMSRLEFREKIQKPLFAWLVREQLMTLPKQTRAETTNAAFRPITDARIRYIVLCYGIPLTITRDATLVVTKRPWMRTWHYSRQCTKAFH